MTIKSGTWVGHLNAILGQGGGNLNEPIFKSSNAQGVAWGMLKLRIDGRIKQTRRKRVESVKCLESAFLTFQLQEV